MAIILFCLFITVMSEIPSHCFVPSINIMGGYSLQSNSKEAPSYLKTAQVFLGLNETICYKVSYEDGAERLYVIRYEKLLLRYPIKNQYNITWPEIAAKCTCLCPGEGQCPTDSDDCSGEDTCIFVTADTQTPKGCLWIGHQAQTCCTLKISSGMQYQAVELSSFITLPQFTVQVIDLRSHQTLSYTRFNHLSDMEGHLDLDLKSYLKISYTPTFGPLPAAYYLTDGKRLYPGAAVNRLNEWDTQKAGWFKSSGGEVLFNTEIVKQNIQISTTNCGENNLTVRFNGQYYSDKVRDGSNVKSIDSVLGEPLNHVTIVNNRMIDVNLRSGSLLKIAFYKKFRTKSVAWLTDESQLESFTVTIVKRPYRENLFVVKLRNVIGRITGVIEQINVSNSNAQEEVYIVVPEFSRETEVRMNIDTDCRDIHRVCLKPSTLYKVGSTCATATEIECVSMADKEGGFVPPPLPLSYTTLTVRSNYRMIAWLRHLQLTEMIRGRVSAEEVAILVLYLAFSLALIWKMVWCYRNRKKNVRSASQKAESKNNISTNKHDDNDNNEVKEKSTYDQNSVSKSNTVSATDIIHIHVEAGDSRYMSKR